MNSSKITELANNIKRYRDNLEKQAIPFRTPEKANQFDLMNYNDWCNSVFGDGLIKLRLFTENNFNVIETLSLVSVTRYIFELSVWLNLFILDPRYGLVYYAQLFKSQLQYWERYKEQLEKEIVFLKELGDEESQLISKKMDEIHVLPKDKQDITTIQLEIQKIYNKIDSKAAKKFSIHAEQARHNGYEFQAYLIGMKQLPTINDSISEIKAEKALFESTITDDIKALIPKLWKWNLMAQKVGLNDEYNFIYSYTSKLLHAVPSSITTDSKNLESDEMILFLKYIDNKIQEIIELSDTYLEQG
ncbi:MULTISPECIES: hypothetical protein [Providencia]|uniref:hypothetical protein n=1 Tax=Providencia TaxID=586 RepID=UPI0021D4FF72|nr:MULTISPECIES: hypothetical protein [Providencia]WIE09853.1 hypothetical protein N4838_008505 [Providencia rettgeri]